MLLRGLRVPGVVAVLALVLAGCGTGPAGDTAGPRLSPAAEPADAPEPARAPVGQVVALGPVAEGVVADPVTGLVAAGLRDPFRL
ncbi:MAG: hypothetical protein M3408_13030, partial [Actinomycetota bacterium]|nr:hypothetical protein [Actinomycetota bacterium]